LKITLPGKSLSFQIGVILKVEICVIFQKSV
jgi:hypothetical protein